MAGTTFTWTTAGSSVWTLGTNWSPAGPPSAADTAIVPTGTVLVNTGTVGITDLSLGGSLAAPIPGKGTVEVTAGAAIQASDAIALWSGSTLSLDQASSVDIGTSGTAVAGNIDIESGHTLQGDGLVQASVVNNGTIDVLGTVASNVFTPGTLEITGNLTGSGDVALTGMNAIVQFDGSVATTQTINFGTGSELIVGSPGAGFAVPITNLNTGDKIEFAGLQVKSASVTSQGTITVITNTGSYLLTHVSFNAGASQQLFTGTDGTNGDGYIQVAPPFANWAGGSGNLGVTGNWQGGLVPDSTKSASFFNSPGTLTGSAAALSLNIGGTGTWTFNGATITVAGQPSPPFLPYGAGFGTNVVITNAASLAIAATTNIGSTTGAAITANGGSQVTTDGDTIGGSAGQYGSLTVTGANTKWTELSATPVNGNYPGFLTVGNAGTGTLNVNSGGIVSPAGNFVVGNNTGGSGAVTIGSGGTISVGGTFSAVGNHAGSSGTLIINSGGTFESTLSPLITAAVLSIGGDAATGTEPAANGSVLVTGVGALLNTNQHPLIVADTGSQGGQGSLTVAQGGSVVVGGEDASVYAGLNIGVHGGNGKVTITDPGSTLTASGDVEDGRGGTGTLLIQNHGSLVVIDAPLNGSYVGIGAGRGAGPTSSAAVGGNGVATVTTGGMLDLDSTTSGMVVGGNGVNGILNVSNSGTVLTGTGLTVGTATTAGGTIYGGTGALNIDAGGLVKVNNPTLTGYDVTIGNANSSIGGPTGAASGQAVVSGAGAQLNANGAGVAVGWLSSGDLTISQGARVVSGTPDNTLFAALSIGRQSVGNVTITDKGSSYSANGSVYVGRAGAGSLTIENQGSLGVGVDGKGNGGISIGGAGFATGNTLFVGGGGTALVDTGGDLASTQDIKVGENGTDGTLTINNGGTAEADQRLFLGNSVTAAVGDTIIDSAGTTTVATATLVAGDGLINVGPGGVLKVDGTAIGAPGTPSIVLGAGTGASGTLNVSGAGASVKNAGGFQVGVNGRGNLTIQSSGTVITSPGTVAGLVGADIAAQAGSDGSEASVTGTGSDWQVGGALLVGDAASGSLSITAGATVTASTLDAGKQANSSGIVSVVGTNSDLTTTGTLSIGDAGVGELSILNGANVTIGGDLNIGQTAGGSGNVDIEDTTGTVFIGANLNIGAGGPGILTVGPNATVFLDHGGQVTGPNAVLNLFSLFDPIFDNNTGLTNVNVTGTQQYLAYVNNTGSIVIGTGKTYTLETPTVYGAGGTFQIGTNAGLILNADTVTGQTIAFADASGKLTVGFDQLQTIDIPPTGTSGFTPIANPNLGLALIGGFGGVISNFQSGDTITVHTTAPATFSQSGSLVSVIENGATVGALTFATVADAVTAATTPGALVDVCFCAGTAIATPDGDILVERLAAGHCVLTLNGEAREIIWIGTGKVLATRGRRNEATPVIVRKGALADNVPHRDLYVTKGHSFYFDGVLVPIEFLVNHRSILWDDRAQEVTIYHIELVTHDVLLANGAPAESYRDDGNRWLFQNSNPGWTLPPQASCAPVLTGGPIVDAIWRRLMDRVGPRKGPPLTDDPDLHLLADGNRLDPIERNAERCVFRLSGKPRTVRLRSRAAIPQELSVARDARCLGVSVRRMVLAQARRQQAIEAASALLAEGWHPFEPDDGIRWTEGDAAIPASLFSSMARGGMLILHMGPPTRYLDEGDPAILAA